MLSLGEMYDKVIDWVLDPFEDMFTFWESL